MNYCLYFSSGEKKKKYQKFIIGQISVGGRDVVQNYFHNILRMGGGVAAGWYLGNFQKKRSDCTFLQGQKNMHRKLLQKKHSFLHHFRNGAENQYQNWLRVVLFWER